MQRETKRAMAGKLPKNLLTTGNSKAKVAKLKLVHKKYSLNEL